MKKLKALVSSMGGTIEDCGEGRYTLFQIDSPTGYVWAANSLHCIKLEWLVGDRKYKSESIQDALERVSLGVTECDDPECDYCNPESR